MASQIVRGRGRPVGTSISIRAGSRESLVTALSRLRPELLRALSDPAPVPVPTSIERRSRHSKPPRDERTERLIALRISGQTLKAIGESCVPPLTKERVRQLIAGAATAEEKARMRDRRRSAEPRVELPGRAVVYGWLRAAGYRRCYGECRQWVEEREYTGSRCKACNRKCVAALRARDLEGARAKSHAYYVAHPEVHRRAAKRYLEKHREEKNAEARAWRAAHPEESKARSRAAYERRKARRKAAETRMTHD